MGSDVSCECISARQAYFNPRSRMGSDGWHCVAKKGEFISIHAPAWGATPVRFPALRQFPYFNPRSSHGERRIRRWNRDLFQGFQSTLPAWGAERPAHQSEDDDKPHISIHVPRMGSDAAIIRGKTSSFLFQSTLPAWGATCRRKNFLLWMLHFNPRPPHGERPGYHRRAEAGHCISIHAPRMGSDRLTNR